MGRALHERQSWTVTVPCFPFAGTTSSAPVTRLLMCRYVSDQVSLERPLLWRTIVPLKWPEAFVTFTDWSFAACFAVSRAVIFTAVACLAPATPASAANPIAHEMSVSSVRFILIPHLVGPLRTVAMSLVHPGGGLPSGTAKSMLWKRFGRRVPS